MTWNIEMAIEKQDMTLEEIASAINFIEGHGYVVAQANIRPHAPSP